MHTNKWLALLLALLLCLPAAAMGTCADCSLLEEEDVAFFHEQLKYLVETIGTRLAYEPAAEEACDYLTELCGRFGYTEDDENLVLMPAEETFWGTELGAWNVIATLPAKAENAPIVVMCAHYDSVTGGARDNASGTSAVLTLMQHFTLQGPFDDLELRFIYFTAEETGHQGSLTYVSYLTEEERQRIIAVFNVDILVADVWEEDMALSLDTLGMRTQNGYVKGSSAAPANNQASRAFIQARQEQGSYDPDGLGLTYCDPRYMGDSDHQSFHLSGMDSVNVCFRGNVESNGHWPALMHSTADGSIGDFDWDRTYQALDTLMLAVEGLAQDPEYGGGIPAE